MQKTFILKRRKKQTSNTVVKHFEHEFVIHTKILCTCFVLKYSDTYTTILMNVFLLPFNLYHQTTLILYETVRQSIYKVQNFEYTLSKKGEYQIKVINLLYRHLRMTMSLRSEGSKRQNSLTVSLSTASILKFIFSFLPINVTNEKFKFLIKRKN